MKDVRLKLTAIFRDLSPSQQAFHIHNKSTLYDLMDLALPGALLTNELHRHLGTYSILGAKMGIRAREILGADLDGLTVVSRTGLKPPLSCFNDGLQAATGASLGQGTIRVLEGGKPSLAATLQYGSQKLTLRLKDEIYRQIQAEQKAAVARHGGLGPEYFRDIRAASLKHWLELDRRKIFEETLEQGN